MTPVRSPDVGQFAGLVADAIESRTLISLVLSGARPTESSPSRLNVRPVDLKGRLRLQWTSQSGAQEKHENLSADASVKRVDSLLGRVYRNAVLKTQTEEVNARITKRGKLQVSSRPAVQNASPAAHNRERAHLIPAGVPCPFLHRIGVMTADGQVRAPQQHKFRQINRYLEFVRDVLPELPAEGPLRVVDCGCGKSGLTFALRHFLTEVCGREVQLTGLDWNADVLETCRRISGQLGWTNIDFRPGDIASYETDETVHLVVSLHACDTATDAALAQAIRWGANVILSVPCCQHELSPQLESAPLDALLRHGILRERLAADVTDALRAALLEVAGYRTQVLEFIDLEHTPKNLLLRAVRRPAPISEDQQRQWTDRFESLKRLLGIESQALEKLLSERLTPVQE
ncbi:MAG: SAM-dependent methyltransferase [Planctomycetaceae bacterium]|nr:SAM-dependent methyltransferase [Planctomycetaceae bacterium]